MEKFKLYLIEEPEAESLVNDNDLDGFRQYLEDETYLNIDIEEFDTEEERTGFLSGYFHGCDERSPAGKVALIDGNDNHQPYIEIINELWN